MDDWSIGIDTGGTFTDLAAVNHDTAETFVAKVPSTPSNPSDGILHALSAFLTQTGATSRQLRLLSHGTTVATNALLESKGARAGLLITEGFRAIYPARGGTRPTGAALIDLSYRKPELLIPLSRTHEIHERIGFDGLIRVPLQEAHVRQAARSLRAQRVEAVAICFLFSFVNSRHEERAAEIFAQEFPECRVSLSSRVLPVIREYPRLSTVALDAYVGPVVQRYLEDLAERVAAQGVGREKFFIMQSYGGLIRIDVAARYPNETLLSGPAAGVAFAAELGRAVGAANIVTFDMGGTSTDISLIANHRVSMARNGQIAGQDIGTPMIEIETLGAGGGAIAHIGHDGYLKVGPQSAGAFPGPACYGLGGGQPTVTDANVALGYLDPTRFAGGGIAGSREFAIEALTRLGRQLGMSPLEVAIGVRRVVNSYMMSGVRLHAVSKGGDLREFALLAFGGAGPLHAAELAEDLGIPRVIIPPHPGITCAMGLLLSDVKHLYLQSFPAPLEYADPAALELGYQALAMRALDDARIEGFAASELSFTRQMDVRYQRQGYDLTLDVPASLAHADDLKAIRGDFDRAHHATYGVSAPGERAEIVTLRLQSLARVPHMALLRGPGPVCDARPVAHREVYFGGTGHFVLTPVYDRAQLAHGTMLHGPLIVEQLDSTSVIGPRQKMTIDALGNLVVEPQSIEEPNA